MKFFFVTASIFLVSFSKIPVQYLMPDLTQAKDIRIQGIITDSDQSKSSITQNRIGSDSSSVSMKSTSSNIR